MDTGVGRGGNLPPGGEERTETLPPGGGHSRRGGDAGAEGRRTGAALGRYVLLDLLGTGGMGEVYAAYDRRLDRKVALKLLRPDRSGDREAARLLREAQALARLAHPNVVAVHDVGVFDDGVFVAMEFVEGPTLRSWLEEAPRPWRRVLEVFAAAGRGLAAVHEAGLVHRDVKPDNVMLRPDGRVLLMDFGLARAVEDEVGAPAVDTPPAPPETPREHGLVSTLTETGTLLGTPAYMAPEQLRGEPADARSDQYAFCLALREALSCPASGTVPRWLRRAVETGTAADPAARHPSMEALLAHLQRGLRGRRRRLATAALGLVVLFGAGSFVQLERARRARCGSGEALFAGVWNPQSRAAVHAAFAATGAPLADAAWASVSSRLERWGAGWADARRGACEATYLRGEQSQHLLDLRMACYDRRLREVEALVGVLEGADAEAVELAPEAAASLPATAPCDDAERLLARVPPPEDPALRARIEALEAEVPEVKALRDLGRFEEAAERGRRLLVVARELDYPPTVAEVAHSLAEVESERGEDESAEALLHEALAAAEAGGDDPLFGRAAAELVWVLAGSDSRLAEADRWLRLAEGALSRVGDDPELEAILCSYRGAALRTAGHFEEAVEQMRRALELDERSSGPDSVDVSSSLNNLATGLADLGRYDEAIAALERSLAIKESLFGRDHPEVATALGNLGVTLWKAGRPAEALPYHEEALAIRERVLPPDHPFLGKSHANLATALYGVGRVEEGLVHDRIGLEIRRRTLGERHFEVGFSWVHLGDAFHRLGRSDESLAAYREALSIFEGALGENVLLADPLDGLGETLIDRGEPDRALAPLERALALRRGRVVADKDLASTLFLLARALRATGRSPERARSLAEEALERYGRAGEGYAEKVREVEAWLEAEPAGARDGAEVAP